MLFYRELVTKNMELHRQACGTSCYAQTGDILSKELSPTAKAMGLCVERWITRGFVR